MVFGHRVSSLVVVDPTVQDHEILLQSIHPHVRVFILDRDRDGVEQISEAIAALQQSEGFASIESLHILSHGTAGALRLGTTALNWQTLDRYAAPLRSWAKALKQNAEILLYGCEVAAGAIGQRFVQQLKSLTGAEVAASTNLTGHSKAGGDWVLEYATAEMRSAIAFSAAAMAAYPHVLLFDISETFRNSTFDNAGWVLAPGSTPGAEDPFLTAGTPGGDVQGQGALRLTSDDINQSAFVLYDVPLDSRQGLTATFEIFAYGGEAGANTPAGADGISFFLLDGLFSPTAAGAFGGSLGYAQRLDPAGGVAVPGLAGAYVGVGFDEFGNFSSATDSAGGPAVRDGGEPARVPDSIGVRAGAGTGYTFAGTSGTLPFEIDNLAATPATRELAKRTIKIDLSTSGLLNIQIDGNGDGDFLDVGETNPALSNINIADINGTALPAALKFGFAASTGDSTNFHEIRNLRVTSLNNPPTALDFGVLVPPDAPTRVTGFAGTDPDIPIGDSIASYLILSLPSPTQGTLYLGNPTTGGTAITALPPGGLTLTPAQIQNIYFLPVNGFSNATFSYSVTDSRGTTALVPATATIGLQTVTGPGGGGGGDNNGGGTGGGDNNGGNNGGGDGDQGGNPNCIQQAPRRGNDRNNTLEGTPNSDSLFGRGGNDRLFGFDCPDLLDGGAGNDRLVGARAADRLRGRQNNDIARGNAGEDLIDLGLGNDRGFGGTDDDTIFGRRGTDRLDGKVGDDRLLGGRGNDRVDGNDGDDALDGQQNNDVLRGGSGSDLLNGGLGNDRLRGSRREDTGFGRRGDDVAWGGGGVDRLLGEAGNDRLAGNTQADILSGGGGNDVLTGGTGNDLIRTGKGADRIVYRTAQDGVDTIFGFNVGRDVVTLQQIFRRSGYTSSNRFRSYVRLADGAEGAILRVDSNGSAASGFVQLAVFQGVEASSLSANNFVV